MNFGNAINKYRPEGWIYTHGMKPLSWPIRSWIYMVYNSFIPPSCEIGKGTVFGYKGIGVVIHSRAVIGEHCMIRTNVTVGGRSGFHEVPVGNGVEICIRAKVLGPVHIGDNAIIGANAVVIENVPDNAVVGRIEC